VKGSLVEGQTLTALVNNAGVYSQKYETSADGLEITWAVNVAAPFLLTSLLLDRVSDRVVNVASISAAYSVDFGVFWQEMGYSPHTAYSMSKLANIMFSNELASLISAAGKGISSNSLDPGTVNTKMLLAGWGPIGMRVEDANDEFNICTRPSLGTGNYFVSSSLCKPPPPAIDLEARKALWGMLCEQTKACWSL